MDDHVLPDLTDESCWSGLSPWIETFLNAEAQSLGPSFHFDPSILRLSVPKSMLLDAPDLEVYGVGFRRSVEMTLLEMSSA